MKRIGIISYYYQSKNMGGLLQSYALQKAISQLGIECEQICFDNGYMNEEQKRMLRKLRREQVRYTNWLEILKKLGQKVYLKLMPTTRQNEQYQKQVEAYNKFEKCIPHTVKVYNSDTIDQTNELFDGFVCGSDVIWQPSNVIQSAYYLCFANEEKIRLSYAASMGRLPFTPLEKELFLTNIKPLPFLSLREKSVAEYIENIAGKKTCTVTDPTLLLNSAQWKTIEDRNVLPNCKYIFCYIFNGNVWCRKYVAEFAKRVGLPIVYFPYIMNRSRRVDDIFDGIKKCDVGPAGFVSLIHHAEYVFTDSFHAVVFSTLFQKQFYVFDRDRKKCRTSINARVDEFLAHYGMEDRKIGSIKTETAVGSSFDKNVLSKIERDREASLEYLKEALGINYDQKTT